MLGHTSMSDNECSRYSVEVATSKTIEEIHGMREIVEAFRLPDDSVDLTANDHLGMRQLSIKWMPRLSTIDRKSYFVTAS